MIDRILALAAEGHAETVRIRRHLHRQPELAFEEHKTAALIAETLREIGLEPITGVATTGVVAHVHGERPGPVRALRADIDALPIREANTFEFASETDGVMHACGHDAHTAMLLSAARILHATRAEWAGTVRLLFQPSEEKVPGGAKVMIEEGALGEMEGVGAPEAIFGQHVAPHLPTGTVGVRPGPFMASADELYLTVRGEGGPSPGQRLLREDQHGRVGTHPAIEGRQLREHRVHPPNKDDGVPALRRGRRRTRGRRGRVLGGGVAAVRICPIYLPRRPLLRQGHGG